MNPWGPLGHNLLGLAADAIPGLPSDKKFAFQPKKLAFKYEDIII
jgi:hypothetical protein